MLGARHCFELYRDFLYEFYPIMGLTNEDVMINSPMRKYSLPEPNHSKTGRYRNDEVGHSYCTHEEVVVFIQLWN